MQFRKLKDSLSQRFKSLRGSFSKQNLSKLKPSFSISPQEVDWGELFHVGSRALLPFVLLALINLDLTFIAIIVVLLSKWRMFAVRPSHLPANIRANSTDLAVKLSSLALMTFVDGLAWQLVLAAWYAVWLLLIKPQSSKGWVAAQALLSQFLALSTLFWFSDGLNDLVVLAGVWTVVYVTSYHYLSNFEDKFTRVIAKLWALVAVQIAWVFLRWNLVFFDIIPQYSLFQTALSVLAADIYSSRQDETLDKRKARTYIIVLIIILAVIIISGDWSGQLT